jgi:flagellin
MFRINNNIFSINAQRHLFESSGRMGVAIERLASGLRINRAGDDPAGLGASELMRAQIAGARQANRNVSQAISLLQTADGGYEQILNMFTRLKELAIQAADGTLGPDSRSAISLEASQLFAEMDRVAQSTVFNGMTLVSSALGVTRFTFFVGDGSISGTSQQLAVILAGIGVTSGGFICIGSVAGTGSVATMMITAAFFLTPNSASQLSAQISSAITSVAQLRTTIGAYENRLSRTQLAIQSALENAINAESIIRDADFAEETSALTRNQIITQAGASVLTQANALPQVALLLLG